LNQVRIIVLCPSFEMRVIVRVDYYIIARKGFVL
jgi:hypothetical protein